MVIEDTIPQNSLSEAGHRLKSHKTDIHPTFSSLLIYLERMNPTKYFPIVHRPVQMSGVVIQAAKEQSTKSRSYKLKASLMWNLLP